MPTRDAAIGGGEGRPCAPRAGSPSFGRFVPAGLARSDRKTRPEKEILVKLPFTLWRGLFALAGILIVFGGLNHPRGGGMAKMLADPDWVWAHGVVTAGFAALLLGLVLYRRSAALPRATDRWSRWAVIGAALQTVEMAVHTAAAVDAEPYAAGEAAPVFTIHMTLAVLLNPVFALLMGGLIWVGARERALGSPAINWLGLLGAAAHGLAVILVVVLGLGQFGILFPMMMLLGLWLVIGAFWPIRVETADRAPAGMAGEAG